MIEVVTFDLDDTLWPIRAVIIKAEAQMQTWLAARVPRYPERVTQTTMGSLRRTLLTEQPQLAFNISDLRKQLLRRSIELCDVDKVQARDLADGAFEVFMLGRNRVELYADALPTLDTLKQNYRLGALTNGNADIKRIGLTSHLEFSISPFEAQARKPDAAIFDATLARAGCAREAVVHVGDHPIEDIDGAAAAGWHCIWVNLNGAVLNELPPYTAMVTRLADLPAAIDAISEGEHH